MYSTLSEVLNIKTVYIHLTIQEENSLLSVHNYTEVGDAVQYVHLIVYENPCICVYHECITTTLTNTCKDNMDPFEAFLMHFSMNGTSYFVENEADVKYPPNEDMEDKILYNSSCVVQNKYQVM